VRSERAREGRTRGRAIALLGLVLLASSIGAPVVRATQAAQAAPELGFGQAQAVLVMIDPRSAELSFGVRFGPTITDHRNRVARAVAQSTDYGLIGTALTGASCTSGEATLQSEDLPQRLRADSRTPGDDQEKTVQEGPITQSVRATAAPFARATSRLAEVEIPGAVRVAGASNHTTSGVDDDGVPIAEGQVDIAELSLAAGAVVLRGLHWEATFRKGEEPQGAFTIASATIGGMPVPSQDASAVVAAVNDVLGQLGLIMSPPRSHVEEGTLFVDPIRIGIAPNATRDQVAGVTLASIQPIREQLFGALLEASCDSGALITVLDILLGSFTGGGSLTVNVGGTQARVADSEGFTGFGSIGPAQAPTLGPTSPGRAPSGALGPLPPVPGRTPAGDRGSEAAPATPAAATDEDTESDGALAVGLVAVLLGAVLVEADRRKMRQVGAAG
jgi:hypothetical protein